MLVTRSSFFKGSVISLFYRGRVQMVAQSASNGNDFLGLILNLSKLPIKDTSSEKIFAQHSGYTVLGYYDQLDIQPARNWPDLTPAGMQYSQPAVAADAFSIPKLSIDSFPIKLLFPPAAIIKLWKNAEFDYSYWEKLANRSSNEKNPIITVVLLNMTDEYLRTCKTPSQGIVELLNQLSSHAKALALTRSLHCGIFQSIGMYDYALLMESNSISAVFQMVEGLRSLSITRDGVKSSILSNSYTILGVRHDASAQEIVETETLSICIRFALRCGISAETFAQKFFLLAEEKGLWKKDERTAVAQCAAIRGQYDCQVCLELPLQTAFSLFLPNSILEDSELCNMFVDSNTLVRRKFELDEAINQTSSTLTLIPTGNHISAEHWKKYDKLLLRCMDFWRKNHCHTRTLYALQQLFRLLHSLSCNTHNQDVITFLSEAFDSLCFNIQHYVLDDLPTDLNIRRQIEGADEVLESFRQYVGGYMLDLAHSERVFIEDLKLSHVSIGSATKLLFAYNQMLRELVSAVSRNSSEGLFSYSFVVVSGGCDSTVVENIFDSVPLRVNGKLVENRLLVIRLSEMSIYDIRGTMLRSIHEAWHYCGNRYRERRSQYACESLSRLLARVLAQLCFPPHAWSEYTFELNDKASYSTIEDTWYMRLYRRNCRKFEYEFSEKINEFLRRSWQTACSEYVDADDERCYYSGNFWSACQKTLFDAMTRPLELPLENRDDDILLMMYPIWWKNRCEYLKDLCQEGRRNHARVQRFELQYHELCAFDPDSKSTAIPVRVKLFSGYIQTIADALVVDNDYLPWENLESSTVEKVRETYQLVLFTDTLQRAYVEAFSDIMAIKTLNASISDYLFSLVYEGWDLDYVLPEDDSWALRLGAVFEVCYDGDRSQGLLPADVEAIHNTFESFISVAPWTKNRFDVNRLIDRVNTLLCSFSNPLTLKWISEPLVDYLKDCPTQLENPLIKDRLKNIREVYSKSSVSGRENGQAIFKMLQYWIDLNHSEGNEKNETIGEYSSTIRT